MGLSIPNSNVFQNPMNAVPFVGMNEQPVEGPLSISCEVDWSLYPLNSVSFNAAPNPGQPNCLSQITALQIDNSQSGVDVQFLFPDTGQTITIPAYSPYVLVPVISRSTVFYLATLGVTETEDITRFQILNVLPPPVSVPTSQEQESISDNSIDASTVGTTTMLANNVNGTLEFLSVFLASGTPPGFVKFNVQDGAGKVIGSGNVGTNTENVGYLLINMPMSVRFSQGLVFDITSSTISPGSIFTVNALYRTP